MTSPNSKQTLAKETKTTINRHSDSELVELGNNLRETSINNSETSETADKRIQTKVLPRKNSPQHRPSPSSLQTLEQNTNTVRFLVDELDDSERAEEEEKEEKEHILITEEVEKKSGGGIETLNRPPFLKSMVSMQRQTVAHEEGTISKKNGEALLYGDTSSDPNHPMAIARPSAKFSLLRVQNINSITEFTQIMSEDVSAVIESVFCAAVLLLGANFFLKKIANRSGLPEVLLFLFSGMLLRFISDPLTAAKFDVIAKPFVRMSLTAMGLQIGSHLNKAVLAPLFKPLLRFSCAFVPTVLLVSTFVASMLFPRDLSQYAWLVGSVALERSSPEALHGIAASKSAGPFTNATMAIAALQDIYALVAFVIFSAVVGSPLALAALHLLELAVGTMVATVMMVLAVRAVGVVPYLAALFVEPSSSSSSPSQGLVVGATNPPSFSQKATPAPHHKRTNSLSLVEGASGIRAPNDEVPDINNSEDYARPQPSTPTTRVEPPTMKARRLMWLRVLVGALVFIIPFLSWFFHVELLLAAVMAGSILSWDSPHSITLVLDSQSNVINIALFCLLGHRISIVSYLQNIPGAFVIFIARLVGLWLGAMGGGILGRLHVPPAPSISNGQSAAGGRELSPPTPLPSPAGASVAPPVRGGATAQGAAIDTSWHNSVRWMGLVTQLGIALSLVDRMEEQFPLSAPMARACGGSVIGALLVGPSLLQFVLRRVGEAGKGAVGAYSPRGSDAA